MVGFVETDMLLDFKGLVVWIGEVVISFVLVVDGLVVAAEAMKFFVVVEIVTKLPDFEHLVVVMVVSVVEVVITEVAYFVAVEEVEAVEVVVKVGDAKLVGEVVSITMLKLMLELAQNCSQNESFSGPLVLLPAVDIRLLVVYDWREVL